jgi:hypothetical protein
VAAPRGSEDGAWGRVKGARPPLSPAAPLLFWLASAVALAVLVFAVIRDPGPLDDPNEGDQRAGFLVDRDDARTVADLELPGDPIGRRPVVVIFDRRVPPPQELREFVREAPDGAAVVLVVPTPVQRAPRLPPGVRLVAGTEGEIADAVGMPEPRDGGAPVGYAVIDDDARVRYATLDPQYLEHAFELDIVASAVA